MAVLGMTWVENSSIATIACSGCGGSVAVSASLASALVKQLEQDGHCAEAA